VIEPIIPAAQCQQVLVKTQSKSSKCDSKWSRRD